MKIVKYIIIGLLFFNPPLVSNAENIQDYIKQTSNRYSKHFDKNGWNYNQPNYSIINKTPNTAREWAMFASYYYGRLKNKEIKSKVAIALQNAILELQTRPTITQSFNDSIAHFLIYQQKNLLTEEEKKVLLSQIKESIFTRYQINDTENRGIISGVLDSYLAKKLRQEKLLDCKNYQTLLSKNIKKINKSIENCIDQDAWYYEGDQKYFSAHYHILAAYFLMFYADYFDNPNYFSLAKKMTGNIRKMSFQNGFTEAKIGMRPIGLGAQTYLMLGILNKRFGYQDYSVYLNFAKNRFFSDKNYPNRLEFHSTIADTEPIFHDDIGFSLVAELSKIDKKIKKTKIKKYPLRLTQTNRFSHDKRFTIKNYGGIIIVNDKEFRLSTNSEYSKVTTIK